VTGSTNLDLVRSIVSAWERGDFSSAEWAHREIEFSRGLRLDISTGLAGMADSWRDVLSAWEDLRFHADEYRQLDHERVLVLAHLSGQGKTSGLEVGQLRSNAATLFHVRSGKVTRLIVYGYSDRALADLGLAPETGSTR
jgi:hypothetical protein